MRVHNSQAYRKMDVARELREILLPFQNGFNLVNAAVAFGILDSISGLEPSSVITEPRYLTLVSLKFLSIYVDLCVDATGVVCHQLGLLSTDLHAVGCRVFVETLN